MSVYKSVLFLMVIGLACVRSIISFKIDISDPSSLSRSDIYRDYLIAELNLSRKAPKESLEMLHKLSGLPLSPEAKKNVEHALVRILSKNGRYEQVASKDKALFENDMEVQLLFAEAYINTGRLKDAEGLLRILRKKFSTNEQVVYFLGVLLVKQGRNDEAITEIDSFLSKSLSQPKHAMFHLLKAKIYMSINKGNDALIALDKGIELYPEFDKAWLMRALLLQNKQDIDGAVKSYKKFLDISPNNNDVRRQLVTILASQRRFEQAKSELEKINDDTDSHYFNLSLLEWKSGDLKSALVTINKSLEKKSSNIKAKVLKVELLAQLKKINEALQFVGEWLEGGRHESVALKTLIALKGVGAPLQSIIAILEPIAQKSFRRNITAFLGDFYFDAGLYAKALLSYMKLEKIVSDSTLRVKLLYQIGYANFIMGHYSEVEKPLLEVLKIDKNHSASSNLLASYYAHEDYKLSHALELIESALKIDSKNSAFLDTKKQVVSKLEKRDTGY
jgi:tetratricopeptide (TPR) repeat protein